MNKNIPNNKSSKVQNYIQKLLKEEGINNIKVLPVCIEKNPYERFGICDSEGEIDFVRIKRIRKTQYYQYYKSFRDYHNLNKDYIDYFFGNFDCHTEYEDWTYVEQGIEI